MYSVMYSDSADVVLCPYNKNHRVAQSKFQRHLVKCEKNYPPDYRVICPYNATHRFSKSEIEKHIDTCPMRKTVEGSYIQLERAQGTASRSPEQYDSVSEIDYNGYWNSQKDKEE